MSAPARQMTSVLFSARNCKLVSASADIDAAAKRFCSITCHRQAKLEVDLVSYGHDLIQQHAVVDVGQVFLQGVEDADLQYPGFFYQHHSCIALPEAVRA